MCCDVFDTLTLNHHSKKTSRSIGTFLFLICQKTLLRAGYLWQARGRRVSNRPPYLYFTAFYSRSTKMHIYNLHSKKNERNNILGKMTFLVKIPFLFFLLKWPAFYTQNVSTKWSKGSKWGSCHSWLILYVMGSKLPKAG